MLPFRLWAEQAPEVKQHVPPAGETPGPKEWTHLRLRRSTKLRLKEMAARLIAWREAGGEPAGYDAEHDRVSMDALLTRLLDFKEAHRRRRNRCRRRGHVNVPARQEPPGEGDRHDS
jgi:hypothetical protein